MIRSRSIFLLPIVVALSGLTACSGGNSDSSATSTTVVGPPTTVPSRGDGSDAGTGSTLPLLDADLAAANDIIVFPSAIDPASNPDRVVPSDLATDTSEALTVASAELSDSNGVYELVWTLSNGVKCVNCAFVEPRVRKIIASVMEQPFASSITEVRGADPSRTAAADYAGRGWQAEFLVSSTEVGDQIVAYVTTCETDSCRSKDLHIGEVIWQNKVLESATCGDDLSKVASAEAFPLPLAEIPASAAADAGIDRVIVASPAYRPILKDSDDGFVVSGWNETGCAA